VSLDALLLERLAPWASAPRCWVAFSGGLDSTLLLSLLAQHPQRDRLPPLHAIHVHHGLQAEADAWAIHCQRLCASLNVPLSVLRVRVAAGASLEQEARRARYAAFESALGEGELLLLGQHRDDQAETLLLRLLRGAGVRGLAGMPVSRALGRGQLLRPLLDVPREQLREEAERRRLDWLEDPSNADLALDRNRLRHQVLPLLRERWPQADARLAAAAAQCAEDAGLLAELAEQDLEPALTPSPFAWLLIDSLELAPLLNLSAARQRNALRHWLAPRTALPDRRHWAGWEALRDAAGDATPRWRLAAGELRRAEGRLWWLPKGWDAAPPATVVWDDPRQTLSLPGNGELSWLGEAPPGPLRVGYRRGGESLQLPGRGRRDLKRLLNEAGIPLFLRDRLPLLYAGERLVAVANLAADTGPRWCFATNSEV